MEPHTLSIWTYVCTYRLDGTKCMYNTYIHTYIVSNSLVYLSLITRDGEGWGVAMHIHISASHIVWGTHVYTYVHNTGSIYHS